MQDNRTLGQGNVEIELVSATGERKTITLKPSLQAVRLLSRKYGGLDPLVKKIGILDFDAVVDTIEAGWQVPYTPKAHAEVEELVYNTGMSDQTGQLPTLCIRYVTILLHGGRLPPEEQQGVGGAQANPPTAS